MGVEAPAQARTAWTERRRRALELIDRYPFAAVQLRLYAALLEVQEAAFHEARRYPPPAGELTRHVAERVLPGVIEVSVAHGPPLLAADARDAARRPDAVHRVAVWLRDEPQDPVDRYLARAATGPVLEALGRAAGLAPPEGAGDRRCPRCGGLPQVAYVGDTGEALVTGPRHLVCSRCQHAWIFARMTCAGCGEETGARLPVYGETQHFPHLRVDACTSCDRYLITVDLRKEPGAVPIVDELAAVPLDLYTREQGKRKIVPNLMGM